jgi:hypothetical protein
MLRVIAQWLQGHMFPCFYKQVFGISCPMCGFQRSVLELLKGNILESFILFPALLPLLVTSLVIIVLKFRKIQNTKVAVQGMLIFNLMLITLNCIYQNIN